MDKLIYGLLFSCSGIFMILNILLLMVSFDYIKQLETGIYKKGKDKNKILKLLRIPTDLFSWFAIIEFLIIYFALKTVSSYCFIAVSVFMAIMSAVSSETLINVQKGKTNSIDNFKIALFIQFLYSITLFLALLAFYFKN